MISIALGVFIIFIIYVAIWSVSNDGARSIEEQKGIIRMRVPQKTTPKHGGGAFSTGTTGRHSHRSSIPTADQPARRGRPVPLSASPRK